MTKPTFTIGVFGIILDDSNRVLLCHRTDYDLWNLPGGVLEHGEAPWEGVIREVKEETGLDVEIERLVGIYSKPERNDIVFQFVCEVVGGEITLNDEADKIEYFCLDDIPDNTPAKQIERIKDTLTGSGGFIMKKQSGKASLDVARDKLL